MCFDIYIYIYVRGTFRHGRQRFFLYARARSRACARARARARACARKLLVGSWNLQNEMQFYMIIIMN